MGDPQTNETSQSFNFKKGVDVMCMCTNMPCFNFQLPGPCPLQMYHEKWTPMKSGPPGPNLMGIGPMRFAPPPPPLAIQYMK